jgi:hypothetical protein
LIRIIDKLPGNLISVQTTDYIMDETGESSRPGPDTEKGLHCGHCSGQEVMNQAMNSHESGHRPPYRADVR